ncbi:transcriptional regulator [Nitratireductor indicus C115]|uniref:Transcriptional regulator n=1 Tax=Nitratireductor indicus C115 TaxID=1231190 RepID=K2NVB4_9HYPH|nr:IclR family transcriptional regulator [Nitratireductor indicus]EKF43270.1 transcriptional regulator [Nitratireductor indicus C115]SFQ54265.1 transcriptional regulator, IclR family [Nitratireductor indicus]
MSYVQRAEYGVRPASHVDEDDPLFVQAVARAMQVLSAFHDTGRPLSLNEIATASGMGRSAAQRVVHTLRQLGYVERDADDRGFVPGIRILDHTRDYLRLNPLVARASPVLLELRRNVRERVDLSLRDGLRLVYAARLQSKRETFFATLVGQSVPIYCTSGGRAVMAHLSDAEVDEIIERSERREITPKTITDPEGIRAKVREARQNGYALAMEEVLQGEVALAAAILAPDGTPLGAIHIAGSLSEWEPEGFCRRFAPLASEAAGALSRF